MEDCLISIIVPVYNVEKYLDKCLESIVSQTYKNIEIILVDDGSSDNCPAMCDEWAKKDSRIKVIHKENGGLSDARNVGLENAKGKYIGFIDSDDYIDKTMFEKLLNKAKENDADMTLCGMSFAYEDGTIKKNIETNLKNCNAQNIATFYTHSQFWTENKDIYTDSVMASVCRVLYKREYIGLHRFDKGMYYEDVLFNLPLLEKKPVISIVNENLYFYCQRAGSIVHSYNEVKFNRRLDFTKVVVERINPLIDEKTLKAFKFYMYYQFVLELAKNGKNDLFKKFKNEKWLQEYNSKENYKCKQKLTKKFKYKVANFFAHKRLYGIFKLAYKIKGR